MRINIIQYVISAEIKLIIILKCNSVEVNFRDFLKKKERVVLEAYFGILKEKELKYIKLVTRGKTNPLVNLVRKT